LQKNFYFLLKNIIQCGDGDGAAVPEPVGDGDRVQFLIPPLGMGRVTSKYMRIRYEDEKCKIRPYPIVMPIHCTEVQACGGDGVEDDDICSLLKRRLLLI